MDRPNLDWLKRQLAQRLAKPLPAETWPDPSAMADASQRIAGLLAGGAAEPVDPERLLRAVRRLSAGHDLTRLETRLCCSGATTPVALDGRELAVIDEAVLTDRLLARVSSQHDDQRLQRRCAFALAHAYLLPSAVPTGSASANWRRLAAHVVDYLERAPETGAVRQSPELLTSLRGVFSNGDLEPFRPFVLEGDRSAIGPIQRLGVPPTSWLWSAILRDSVTQIAHESDASFRDRIESVLNAANEVASMTEQESLLDETVGAVLARLATSKQRDEHPRLRDLSVERWGSPLIATKRPYWLRWTSEAGRSMVSGWLARRVIDSFFKTFSGPEADPRRARFWSRYAEVVDEFRVYLSYRSRVANRHELVELRDVLDDGVRKVDEEKTNVFAITIGSYTFVEFSTTGNALYVYDKDGLPYEPLKQDQRASDFRDRSICVDRLTHQGDWEGRARDMVVALTGEWA